MVEKAKPWVGMRRTDRFLPNPKLKFMEQCREVMRYKQLAHRTEESYLQWIKRFIVFHRGRNVSLVAAPSPQSSPPAGARRLGDWRHPRDMGAGEVRDFLTYLAVVRKVSASTQNQALNKPDELWAISCGLMAKN